MRTGYAEGLDVRVGAWLRRPRRVRGICAAWAGYLLLTVAMSTHLYLANPRTGGAALGALAFFAVFAGLGVFAIWRTATAGLMLATYAIVVRGPIRTRRISPTAAVGFEPGIFGFVGNGTPGPMLKLSDGTRIGIWALGREGLVWNFDRYLGEAERLCDALNSALEQVDGAPVRRELLAY